MPVWVHSTTLENFGHVLHVYVPKTKFSEPILKEMYGNQLLSESETTPSAC